MGTSTVHVWRVDLDPISPDRFANVLSEEERRRASRFHFERDRRRFIVRRGILRELLARYLSIDPVAVDLRVGAQGKLGVETPGQRRWLEFNLSHSQGRVLFAFSREIPLGVDLECVRPIRDKEALVRRFFSPAEASAFLRLPTSRRLDAFFIGWTRKEAFVKAKGTGLSFGLSSFDVALTPGAGACLLRTRYDEADVNNWSLSDIDAGTGYRAALALRVDAEKVVSHHWLEIESHSFGVGHSLGPDGPMGLWE